MSTESTFRVPPGYERGIRFGANWTMIISPYMILYFILIVLVGDASASGDIVAELTFAGNSPIAFKAIAILDGLFHVLFFVTTIALFAILLSSFPVRASLILVCGAWQMLLGFTKGMISFFTVPQLGAAYLAADSTVRSTLMPIADALGGLHSALQWMDSYGSMFVWILVVLLPPSTNLPRSVRWLGWAMTFGILFPNPGFLLVVLLSPFWLFLLGRWMKSLTSERIISHPAMEGART